MVIRGFPAKEVVGVIPARVRISTAPPCSVLFEFLLIGKKFGFKFNLDKFKKERIDDETSR